MGHSDQWQLVEMGFIDSLPDGVAFVDSDLRVQWTNRPFLSILGHADSPVGRTLTELLTSPEFPEIDLSPLTSEDPGQPQHRLILRVDSRKWLGLRSRPCSARTPGRAQESSSGSQGDANSEVIDGYAVTVRDVSLEVMERQKQEAIYRAGLELGNLSPDEVTSMSHDERVDLLKESILEFTQDILGYKTFEIRQLNPFTQELLPLLEFGMNPEAAARRLFARPEENGVTGYVAYTGTPYLCNDTLVDPRYLCGINDAHSSLTVPLMLRDIVLGTFNVESPGTRAFDEQDLEFLLLFGRIVANELNQLQLLVAEKVTTETQNSDRLRREISDPSDIILRDATWILERYIGHDPDVCDRLHRIVEATRKISGRIDHVDEGGPSTSMVGSVIAREPRPKLRRKRILVIDGDIVARDDAHTLLGQMGCFVEAVPNCEDACLMARSHHYDVILTDIRLPDKNGYECFRQLRDINANVPIIMMTGFGYDPTHSIVNARKEGLKSVLYKPFRRGQLLDEVEKAVSTPPPHDS